MNICNICNYFLRNQLIVFKDWKKRSKFLKKKRKEASFSLDLAKLECWEEGCLCKWTSLCPQSNIYRHRHPYKYAYTYVCTCMLSFSFFPPLFDSSVFCDYSGQPKYVEKFIILLQNELFLCNEHMQQAISQLVKKMNISSIKTYLKFWNKVIQVYLPTHWFEKWICIIFYMNWVF